MLNNWKEYENTHIFELHRTEFRGTDQQHIGNYRNLKYYSSLYLFIILLKIERKHCLEHEAQNIEFSFKFDDWLIGENKGIYFKARTS